MDNRIPNIKPFQAYVYNSIPTLFDNSLSYYELLSKFLGYLNILIDSANSQGQQIEALTDMYNTLSDFLVNYLNSESFKDDLGEKLDKLANDGTLSRIINEEIFTEFFNSTRAVGYGDLNETSFVAAVNYCRNNNLRLFLTKDYTLSLEDNLELCEIDGNGHTITLQGSKYFILGNKEVKNLKIRRTENYLSMENVTSTGFTLRNVIFEYPSIDNTLITRALNIGGTGKFIMEDVTAYNYLTPFRIDMVGELSYIKNVVIYNGGQGLYLLNAKKVIIDNLQLYNTGSQRTNIITNYPINGGVAGYDGLLLKNCKDITINNLYIVGAPERVIYCDDTSNVELNNITGIITGGLKFVGYDGIVNSFTVNGGRLDNVSGDALIQLYKCERISINGLTSKNSSTSSGGGWFIRAGQEVRDVRVINCEANNIIRSVFDYDQNFPTAYANPYCGGILFENCTFNNIGLISNLPYPLFNFTHNITSSTNIINTVNIRKCTFKAFGGYADRDNGSRNNYGIKGIVSANYITNFSFEDNTVNGLVDFENTEYPALLMYLTNASNIRFVHKMKSSISDITRILPSGVPFTADSIIDISVSASNVQGNMIVKPRAVLGVNNVIMADDYILDYSLSVCNANEPPIIRLASLPAVRNGFARLVSDGNEGMFVFKTNEIIKKTSDSLFDTEWVADAKVRVYDDSGKVTIRCSANKDITIVGNITT